MTVKMFEDKKLVNGQLLGYENLCPVCDRRRVNIMFTRLPWSPIEMPSNWFAVALGAYLLRVFLPCISHDEMLVK